MKRPVIWLCLLLSLAAACGNGVEAVEPGSRGGASIEVPDQILGLRVQPEKVDPEQLKKIDRPYIDSIAVFSLREGKLLRATLQVARFNRAARPDDPKFRGSITGVLGGTKSLQINVDGTTVESTAGTAQKIYAWFGGRGLFVLSAQQDYAFPRTLLRRLIDLDLKL